MRSVICLTTLVLFATAACGGGGGEPDAGYNCALEDRDDEFIAGMEKVGARGMTFRLVSADPAPPARFENAWVIEIDDASGAPLGGATVSVVPLMPDHGHGTSVRAVVTPDDAIDGRYGVAPINLFMPGLWAVTIQAMPAGGTTADRDDAVFRFCIPG
jgi:hypothetical protein